MKQLDKLISSILYKDFSIVDLTQYLAKGDKNILEHIDDLVGALELLKQLGYIQNNRVYALTIIAIFYHDIGKVNELFQNRIHLQHRFDSSKEVVHNILSLYFIDTSKFENIEDYYSVAHAVLNHHNYCDTYRALQDEQVTKLTKLLLSPFRTFEVKSRVLRNIKKMISDHDSILIKGLLHKCDYSASANIPVEYENDFLQQKLEELLQRWGANAQWNDLQRFCIKNRDQNIIAVAETGMGKTEAGLLWIGNHKGFFILPIRTAINAIYDRVSIQILQQEKIDERLGLLHSSALEYYLQHTSDQELDIMDYYLKTKQYCMPLSISTLDQLFDFVYKYQGYELKVATLSYSKIVIDEIQMYSADLLAYLVYGLKKIYEFGGKIAIVTATFPPFIRDLLKPIQFQEGLFISDGLRHHVKTYHEKINATYIIQKYEDNKQKGISNKILVVCNTVKKAQQLYKELNDIDDVHLLHSRFIQKDRAQKEKEILRFGKTYCENGEIDESNGIWICTQIVEASLDIDFDYLFTELSDLNGLLQRMGRCNRKGIKSVEEPNCFVFSVIDEGILKRGKYGFLDETIYKLSKTAVENLSGILTEYEKIALVNEVFTAENIEQSKFMQEYRDVYGKIESLYDYEFTKSEIDLRHISSRSIIPLSVYEENFEIITENFAVFRNKNNMRVARMRAKEMIMQYTVSISNSQYPENRFNKSIELDKYTQIPIVDCFYSEEEGVIL